MAIESDQLQIQPLPIHKRQGMLPGPGVPSEQRFRSRDLLLEVPFSFGYGTQLYLYNEYIYSLKGF
jgi:hypothetical protein